MPQQSFSVGSGPLTLRAPSKVTLCSQNCPLAVLRQDKGKESRVTTGQKQRNTRAEEDEKEQGAGEIKEKEKKRWQK